MARIVALDIGGKRTGIAITDSLNIIASGLTTVETSELIPYLQHLFKSEEYNTIVVGKPMNLNGTATHATPVVEKQVEQLKKHFPNKKIQFIDERFTSKLAGQSILQSGANKKTRRDKALVDKVSATIILQTYLEIHS